MIKLPFTYTDMAMDDLTKQIAYREVEIKELNAELAAKDTRIAELDERIKEVVDMIHGQYCKLRQIRNMLKKPDYTDAKLLANDIQSILDWELKGQDDE